MGTQFIKCYSSVVDPFFNNVVLLINGKGANGSTTIIDRSSLNLSLTNTGVTINTGAVDQLGTSGGVLHFPGVSNNLVTENRAGIELGTGDFTFECWIYFLSTRQQLITSCVGASGTGWSMDNNKMRWRDGIDLYGSITIPINQWVHLAWTKSGSTCRCWQQGVQVLSITESFDYTPTQYAVGTRGSFPSSIALFAYLSELRLTKGVARYSSNFTPPLSFFS